MSSTQDPISITPRTRIVSESGIEPQEGGRKRSKPEPWGLEAEFREEAFDAEDGAEILDINEEEKGKGNEEEDEEGKGKGKGKGEGGKDSTALVNAKSDDAELSNYEASRTPALKRTRGKFVVEADENSSLYYEYLKAGKLGPEQQHPLHRLRMDTKIEFSTSWPEDSDLELLGSGFLHQQETEVQAAWDILLSSGVDALNLPTSMNSGFGNDLFTTAKRWSDPRTAKIERLLQGWQKIAAIPQKSFQKDCCSSPIPLDFESRTMGPCKPDLHFIHARTVNPIKFEGVVSFVGEIKPSLKCKSDRERLNAEGHAQELGYLLTGNELYGLAHGLFVSGPRFRQYYIEKGKVLAITVGEDSPLKGRVVSLENHFELMRHGMEDLSMSILESDTSRRQLKNFVLDYHLASHVRIYTGTPEDHCIGPIHSIDGSARTPECGIDSLSEQLHLMRHIRQQKALSPSATASRNEKKSEDDKDKDKGGSGSGSRSGNTKGKGRMGDTVEHGDATRSQSVSERDMLISVEEEEEKDDLSFPPSSQRGSGKFDMSGFVTESTFGSSSTIAELMEVTVVPTPSTCAEPIPAFTGMRLPAPTGDQAHSTSSALDVWAPFLSRELIKARTGPPDLESEAVRPEEILPSWSMEDFVVKIFPGWTVRGI